MRTNTDGVTAAAVMPSGRVGDGPPQLATGRATA